MKNTHRHKINTHVLSSSLSLSLPPSHTNTHSLSLSFTHASSSNTQARLKPKPSLPPSLPLSHTKTLSPLSFTHASSSTQARLTALLLSAILSRAVRRSFMAKYLALACGQQHYLSQHNLSLEGSACARARSFVAKYVALASASFSSFRV